MRLRVLGCSGGIGDGLRTTSLLIDDDILIDCGTGVGDLTLEEMARLRHIFITHTHLDHIAALPLLVDTLFDELKEHPLTIHALDESMAERDRPVSRFDAMPPYQEKAIDGRVLQMLPVNHAVPAVGYCIRSGGATVAFSGDTTTNDTLWDALNQEDALDLLIVECAFADQDRALGDLARHYCPSTLIADLAKLRHRPRTCITHLKPGDEDVIFGELQAGLPGHDLYRLRSGDVFTL